MSELTLTQRKRIAARVVAAGGDDAAAGAACGRSARTVRLWRCHDDDFAVALEDAQRGRGAPHGFAKRTLA